MLIRLILVFAGFVLVGGGGVFLLSWGQKASNRLNTGPQKAVKESREKDRGTLLHVDGLIRLEEIFPGGIVRSGGRYFLFARLTGTNFSVISDIEQDAKEDALIRVLSNVDYPVKYISNTVVADVDAAIARVEAAAARINEGAPGYAGIVSYAALYDGALMRMRDERLVLANQSWVAIEYSGDDDPGRVLGERMRLFKESLKKEAGVLLEPLVTEEDALNLVHQVMLPERIIKPGDLVYAGATEPLHFSRRQMRREENVS